MAAHSNDNVYLLLDRQSVTAAERRAVQDWLDAHGTTVRADPPDLVWLTDITGTPGAPDFSWTLVCTEEIDPGSGIRKRVFGQAGIGTPALMWKARGT